MPDRLELDEACRRYDLFDQRLRECATYMAAHERPKVLRFCDKVNLNEFTLFDSEEGLNLEMQAIRVFDLRP